MWVWKLGIFYYFSSIMMAFTTPYWDGTTASVLKIMITMLIKMVVDDGLNGYRSYIDGVLILIQSNFLRFIHTFRTVPQSSQLIPLHLRPALTFHLTYFIVSNIYSNFNSFKFLLGDCIHFHSSRKSMQSLLCIF